MRLNILSFEILVGYRIFKPYKLKHPNIDIMKKIILPFILLFFFSVVTAIAQDEGWTELFNKKDLSNWKQLNGEASYKIENDAIVGISKLKTPNSFLTTKQPYGDFIMEVDVLVDPLLNSGIQIRSQSKADYRDGRVHGYQVEIDPSARSYSGGIYDEARRGWLYPLTENKKGQEAFVVGQWNTYHIEAIGDTLRTWINGVQCASVIDDMDDSGFIALQVHSIGDDKQREGTQVQWKNIKIKTTDLAVSKWKDDPEVPVYNYVANSLTDNEIRKGWRMLWDGKTTKGWRGATQDQFPTQGWEMENGVLTVLESGGEEAGRGGDIITQELFSNFELIIDFKITEGANSGIKYFVDPELIKTKGSVIGLEYQVLDNEVHPDAKMGVNGNRTLSSLYDLIPAENLSNPGSNVPFNGVGAWNRARIVVKDGHVEHWLNNFKVVEFNRFDPIFPALVGYSKYKDYPKFGQIAAGHILIQDHGNTVSYRNIKVREF